MYFFSFLIVNLICTSEVEKQLQGAMTPQMTCKKSSHASSIGLKSVGVGSTGNLHGLIQTQDQLPKNGEFLIDLSYNVLKHFLFIFHIIFLFSDQVVVNKLSTFTAPTLPTTSNKTMVQMRRTTNKRGKQAPAPPKRTR